MPTATFSGNSSYYLDVDAAVESQNQAGNYSTIYWRMIVVKTWGSGFWGSGSGYVNTNVGQMWNQGVSFDFRNGQSTGSWTYAEGRYNVGHDANGYANYEVIGGMTLGSLGSAAVGTGVRGIPRIPKVPQPPTSLGIDQIQATSMRYRFSGNSDNGSGIIEYQVGYGTDPNNPQMHVQNNSGNFVATGLKPGTQYYFWSRGRNGVGWGGYSGRLTARTLAGARVKIGGVWKEAVPYVKVNGVWRMADPYIKVNGVWKIPG